MFLWTKINIKIDCDVFTNDPSTFLTQSGTFWYISWPVREMFNSGGGPHWSPPPELRGPPPKLKNVSCFPTRLKKCSDRHETCRNRFLGLFYTIKTGLGFLHRDFWFWNFASFFFFFFFYKPVFFAKKPKKHVFFWGK